MIDRQRLLLATGFATLVIAVLATAHPTVEASLPAAVLVAALGNDYVLAAVVALVVLVTLVVILGERLGSGVIEAVPPVVEDAEIERPGTEIEMSLRSLSPIRVTTKHRQLHRRLRTIAVETVAAVERCDEPTARRKIETRRWTDDPVASAFVETKRLNPPPIPLRVRDQLVGDGWFRARYGRTIDALEAMERST